MTSEQIKLLRKQRGWSQREFAERMGTTLMSVSRWERGITQPSLMAVRLLEMLAKTEPTA